jgi:hypothetical protein
VEHCTQPRESAKFIDRIQGMSTKSPSLAFGYCGLETILGNLFNSVRGAVTPESGQKAVEVPADPFISPEHNVAQNGGLAPANVPHAVRDTISVLKLPVAVDN